MIKPTAAALIKITIIKEAAALCKVYYTFAIDAADPSFQVEYSLKIGTVALTYEIVYSFDSGAANLLLE